MRHFYCWGHQNTAKFGFWGHKNRVQNHSLRHKKIILQTLKVKMVFPNSFLRLRMQTGLTITHFKNHATPPPPPLMNLFI